MCLTRAWLARQHRVCLALPRDLHWHRTTYPTSQGKDYLSVTNDSLEGRSVRDLSSKWNRNLVPSFYEYYSSNLLMDRPLVCLKEEKLNDPDMVEPSSESNAVLSEMERLILCRALDARDGRPKHPRLRIKREFPTAGLEMVWVERAVRWAA